MSGVEEQTNSYIDNISADYNSDITETSTIFTNDTKTEPPPAWHEIFNGAQAAMTVIGLLLNVLTVITLQINGRGFSRVIRLLLLHQAVADSLVCLCGILILVTPPMALVGDNVISLLICQTWHTQGIYWSLIWVSIANLEVIAIERFIVICFPFKHGDLTISTFRKVIIAMYPLGVAANIMGYMQLHYVSGVCRQEYYFSTQLFKNFMKGHAIWSFFTYFSIPCALFVILYGGIAYKLYSRQQSGLAQSNVIDEATKQMTRTAMVVTIWFLIALGYDLWYYVLGHNGVVLYEKGTIVQKVGIFLSTSNSCVNPIIYALFMPTYRQSVGLTLRCQRQKPKGNSSSSFASTNMTLSTINVDKVIEEAD